MALYLVLITTLGAIRGVHVKEFVEGETVDLDDDDLAGVGLRDGWLLPVSEADAPPVEPLTRYTVLRHELLPPQSDWGAPPQNGDVIELTEEAAAPLIEIGAVQVAGENTPAAPPVAAPQAIAGGEDSLVKGTRGRKAKGNQGGDSDGKA